MPEFAIDCADDPRLDPFRDLKRSTPESVTKVIAEGEKLVLRLLESGCRTESIVCTEAMRDRLRDRFPEGIPVFVAPTPIISRLIGFQFHRGILASGLRPPSPSLASLWEGRSGQQGSLIVACPEIRDPENLGTIIRTAAAFGAAGVITGNRGTDPFSRRVLRTSMGMVLRLPIVQTDDWSSALSTIHDADFESYAAVLQPDAEPLNTLKPSCRSALFLGNEDSGLSDELSRACRRRVTLPMASGVDSLNVAVAAGILLHHFAQAATPD
jgi:tRNA G18 (ribose-2'-O)-methylase SpoU